MDKSVVSSENNMLQRRLTRYEPWRKNECFSDYESLIGVIIQVTWKHSLNNRFNIITSLSSQML